MVSLGNQVLKIDRIRTWCKRLPTQQRSSWASALQCKDLESSVSAQQHQQGKQITEMLCQTGVREGKLNNNQYVQELMKKGSNNRDHHGSIILCMFMIII